MKKSGHWEKCERRTKSHPEAQLWERPKMEVKVHWLKIPRNVSFLVLDFVSKLHFEDFGSEMDFGSKLHFGDFGSEMHFGSNWIKTSFGISKKVLSTVDLE